MNHIFNLLVIILLLVNLAGIGVGATRLTGLPYGLAKVFAVLIGCMVFFFAEHFIGFRQLGWLLPVATAGSLRVLWKQRSQWGGFRAGETAFLIGFGYELLWRYTYPNIDPSSEKLADLDLIASYLQGGHLPVPDLWLSPYLLTQYYSFQHYAAALMGRILQLGPGESYNIGYCVIVGMVMAPAQAFVRSFTSSRASQTLILAALLTGGTGACLFTPWLVKQETPWSSMRFIGSTTADDDNLLTESGILLRKIEYGSQPLDSNKRDTILEMPMEIFSYVVQLGDYHAPLGGYVLLVTALASFGVLLRHPKQKWAMGSLLGTVPLCIAVNTWCFPLQALLVAGCLAFVWKYREPPDWRIVTGTLLCVSLLLYPYFSYFLTRTVGAALSLKVVHSGQHAPLLGYMMQFWPVIGLIVLAWVGTGNKKNKEFRWFAVMVAVLLFLTEIVYIHDIYGGQYERFNTTLKWWPWVAALAVLLLAPLNLSQDRRSPMVRIGTNAVLISTLFYLGTLSREWMNRQKTAVGQLDGAAWLWQVGLDPNQPQNINVTSSIANYLQAHPEGVVLECPKGEQMAFVETGALPLFTGHPAVFGWAAHEQLWRGNQKDIGQRWNGAREFFRGDSHNPLDFLDSLDVRYILWPGAENVEQALFDKISGQIGTRYYFIRFDDVDPKHGIWARR